MEFSPKEVFLDKKLVLRFGKCGRMYNYVSEVVGERGEVQIEWEGRM